MKTFEAETRYNDMKGTASLDFKGGTISEFYDYAKKKGIDITKFDPIGLELYGGNNNFFYLAFRCIDIEKSEDYKIANEGKLPIVKIQVEETYVEFEKLFKQMRVNLILTLRDGEMYDIID